MAQAAHGLPVAAVTTTASISAPTTPTDTTVFMQDGGMQRHGRRSDAAGGRRRPGCCIVVAPAAAAYYRFRPHHHRSSGVQSQCRLPVAQIRQARVERACGGQVRQQDVSENGQSRPCMHVGFLSAGRAPRDAHISHSLCSQFLDRVVLPLDLCLCRLRAANERD